MGSSMRLCFAVLIAASLSFATSAEAGDPKRVWKTVESKHFIVHYYEPLKDVGRRVAVVAEYGHRLLAPKLGHVPKTKTHIVLVDDTDSSNGFANVIPRNTIRLFASAPPAISALNDHDDWLYSLTAHEYTHILHLDSIGGLPKLYNRLVGKTWAPNQIQPRWVIEGLATYQESERSSGGRTRQSLFDMLLRVAALDKKHLDLDAVSNGPRAFPGGQAAYLYGSHFLKFIFDRHGEDKMRKMTWAYGSSPIPYGINRAIERVTGETFTTLYKLWRKHLRDKYSLQLQSIDRRGRREGRRLTFTGLGNALPVYSKDGKSLIWSSSDGFSAHEYRHMPVGSHVGKSTRYAQLQRAGVYDVLANGDMVVERGSFYRTNYSFQDLYHYSRKHNRYRRLTRGLRAHQPRISPNEREIVFKLNGSSKSHIAVMPLQPEAKHRVIWSSSGRYDQAGTPAWSPDGKSIAFSAWRHGGYRDILIHDLRTGKTVELMRDRALDVQPTFGPKGKYLYYSSDRNGVYNVYAYELATKQTYQVTNTIGCALAPTVSKDGKRLAYQGFDIDGYDIYEIALDKKRWLQPELYVDTRPAPTNARNDSVAVSKPRPYRALDTLAPQNYTVQLVSTGADQVLNVQTAGSDIVGLHSYRLAASLNMGSGQLGLGMSYTYSGLWPTLRLSAVRNIANRGGLVVDGDNTRYREEIYGITGSVSAPVFRTAAQGTASLALDYDIDNFRNVDGDFTDFDPNDLTPRLPETDVLAAGLALRFTYSSTLGYRWTIGPQEGMQISGSLRVDHPSLGSDFHALQLTYFFQTFWNMPFLSPTSSTFFRLSGGLRVTDRRRSGAFALGGIPEQNVIDAVINSARRGGTGYLRGYEPRAVSGLQFHLANFEYRQQLLWIEKGVSTLPFYVRRLHFAALMDVGNAFNGGFDLRDFKLSVGGALRLDMVFGYFIPGSLDIGYSHGLTDDGIGEYWLLLTGTL